MQTGESRTCPACNAVFTCNRNDVVNCHCYSVHLSEQQRKQLRSLSSDCVCDLCLGKLGKQETGTIVEEKNDYQL